MSGALVEEEATGERCRTGPRYLERRHRAPWWKEKDEVTLEMILRR